MKDNLAQLVQQTGATAAGPELRVQAHKSGTRVCLGGGSAELALVKGGIPSLGQKWNSVFLSGLEKLSYRRLVLLFAAMHCQTGGRLILTAEDGARSAPPLDAIWQDTALVLGNAFLLTELSRTGGGATSVFEKERALPIENYTNAGLTLGVISGGSSAAQLSSCLSSFRPHLGSIDEILVCGPRSRAEVVGQYPRARLIEFDDDRRDVRPAICAKKNLIAAESRCENLLLIHERIRPASRFAECYQALSPHFEVLACPLRDTEGNRISGWNLMPFHDHTPMARIGLRVAEPDDLSPMHFGIGSAIFAKADVYRRNLLDERLHWGEMEDNHWYRRLWLAGISVGTIDGFLLSAAGTGSLAARAESRWLPSRYSLMHRWLPRQCHTVSQHAAFTAGVLCRAAIRSTFSFCRSRRDLVGSMPLEGKKRR